MDGKGSRVIYLAAEKSLFLKLLRRIYGAYCFLEEEVFFWYNQSRARKLILTITKGIKVGLRGSLLGRLSRVKESSAILDNSGVARGLTAGARDGKNKVLFYLSRSSLAGPAARISQEVSFFPLRACGIIVITAVTVDILLRIILAREITFAGWTVGVLFLLLGLAGLGSSARWQDIRRSSVVCGLLSR